MNIKPWIQAARLRTLPLALAATGMGIVLAIAEGEANLLISVSAAFTALLLQILSNYANDYGDYIKGTDKEHRTDRMLASGMIDPASMKNVIVALSVFTLLFGTWMLHQAFGGFDQRFFGMLGLGLLCIAGALFYTMGRFAFGYVALGDLAVMLFFGPVAVCGTAYLHAGKLHPEMLIPAIGFGALSAAVLNINNIRDIENDREAGKTTLAMLLGRRNAMLYHVVLNLLALLLPAYYIYTERSLGMAGLFLGICSRQFLGVLLLLKIPADDRVGHNNMLRKQSLFSLFMVLCFALCLLYFRM